VEADGGAILTIDANVGERRAAVQVLARRGQIAPSDGYGLYRLIQSACSDDLYFNRTVRADNARKSARHRVGIRFARNFQNIDSQSHLPNPRLDAA